MAARTDTYATRLDDAARAGWLYYVAGNTQEEIAAKMGISCLLYTSDAADE